MNWSRFNPSIPEGVSVATVALMGWMWRLRSERDERLVPGSRREGPWALGPARLKWLNNPGGKLIAPPTLFRKVLQLSGRRRRTPCDPGLCKIFPEAKTAAKAWA